MITTAGVSPATFSAGGAVNNNYASNLTSAEKFEAYQAQLARDFSAYEAQKQRDFEERLSSTAYSRAVEDIKRAGLNPYLMYDNGGFQASTPVGQSAQTVKANSHTTDSNIKSALPAAALLALAKIIAMA